MPLPPADSAEQLRQHLLRQATDQHAQYPQYHARICACTDGHHYPEHRVTLTGSCDDVPDVHYVPGHWQNWRLVEITGRVETKMGVAFEPGDVVLCKPAAAARLAVDMVPSVTCYSHRNGIDTQVPGHKVRAPLPLADGQPAT